MAKKRGRRSGNAKGDRTQERAHRADSNSNSTKSAKSSSQRTKATDLKYDPKKWEAQKFIILNHFEDGMCAAVLNGDIAKPEIDPDLAIALIADMSRDGTPPKPPALDPIYWPCVSQEELGAIGFVREGEAAFQSFGSAPDDKDIKKEQRAQPSQEQKVEDFQVNVNTPKAWAALQKYKAALDTFRSEHPVNFIKHQKLMSNIKSSLDSATFVEEFSQFPLHLRYKMYAELNFKIHSFLIKYIGREYKYLKSNIAPKDGKALFERCNIKQSKPSASSGQAVLKKIISAHQRPGQEYSAYCQFVQDICDEYEEATGGLKLDENLVRLALTERIIDFYKPVMDSIRTNDLTQGITTPLTGEGSISAAMMQYEIDHQKEFRQLRKKKPKEPRERAHAAQQEQRKKATRDNEGDLTFTCEWCAKFRPGKPTSHKTSDCRIKADYATMVCQVCGQKGHPARLCQDGKKGRANQADEDSRSIASSRSHTLKRYIAPPDDELNSAEAMKALKRAHRKNKKQGRHRRYKIVEIDESDDEDE